MKILIVSSYFPPQNAVASLRPYSWAKYWSRAGHEVTVLTTVKRIEKNNTSLDCAGFKVIEVPLKMPFRNLNTQVKVVEAGAQNKDKEQKFSLKFWILANLKKLYIRFIEKTGCFSTIRFPDWHDRWIKDAVKSLPDIDYDLLVTTAGPYSVHRAGLILKKKGFKGKWICDWRDLCTKNHMYRGLFIFWPYEVLLEKKFHKTADFITTVSDGLTETLSKTTKTPVVTIYNGFDEEVFKFVFNNPRKINKKYIISYLGTVYKNFQDPSPLFIALSELNKEGLITPKDITVQFAGNHTANVTDIAKKYNIENYFRYLGFLPLEQSIQIQYDSDAVLFLEFENPKTKGVLNVKIFEYMYVANNIIITGCSEANSAGRIVEECDAGIFLGRDVKKIKQFILEEVKKKRNGEKDLELQKNMEEINKYSRKVQAEKMLELVSNNKS